MPPTIVEVAREAACSKSTVSRYLNGSPLVARDTQSRIETAVARLGYRPNEIGRSLQRQTTQTIGVLVPSLTNPVFASSVAGIQSFARAQRLSVILATSDYDPEMELAAVETLLAQHVRGLVLTVCDAATSKALDIVEREERPFILLFNQSERADRPSVGVDNVAAARAMVAAICRNGHRRIAFLAGRFAGSDRSRLRYRGYAEALEAAGGEVLPPIEVNFLGSDASATMRRIFSQSRAPTALLCSTDLLALAAIANLRALGFRVPEDVSVAGFDGIDIGSMVHPPLATVRQPNHEMGRVAMEILIERMSGRESAGTPALLPFELTFGGTLGPPPHASQNA